ncbi:NADH dehydrogenase [ubiquinone] 1 beta subcomplex subunit 10-B [Camellia lanceoleosa]|uniref:NADH dehydrogenase [ubiquinone] 1 beta subcomplex subunit 10-B n=1 Tax=Camellia lanceoleosa TaxID=1840588 RepID=A0ACC0I3W5_9ERIC|nr:NADH dehydrogenase [ubiquinone] 1 beta subcomplex subunit 10-B [Camellia lanceoleosa]
MGRKKGVVLDEGAPDDFDPENPYKDPVAMLEMREHLVSIISRSVATLFSSTSTPPAASAGARTTAPLPFTVLRLNPTDFLLRGD